MERPWDYVTVPVNVYRTGARAWTAARAMARKFQNDNGLFLASGLAFSLLLYLIPLALIMISVLGYTVLESQEAMDEVQSVIRQFSPRSEQTLSETVAAIGADRGLLGIIGFFSFLLLSTMVFGSTRHVLNTIFQASRSQSEPPARYGPRSAHDGILRRPAVRDHQHRFSDSGHRQSWRDVPIRRTLVGAEAFACSVGLSAIIVSGSLILGLYRFSPVKTLQFRSLMVGTGVAVVLFGLAKHVFAWYAQFAQASIPLYGALGGFLLFFLWLYYASLVFVVGRGSGLGF